MVKAVVGANWGDEGKGKITDMLAQESDIIVRFQGGANAGHTIVNNYGKFALHTLPSGVFYDHTTIWPSIYLVVDGYLSCLVFSYNKQTKKNVDKAAPGICCALLGIKPLV